MLKNQHICTLYHRSEYIVTSKNHIQKLNSEVPLGKCMKFQDVVTYQLVKMRSRKGQTAVRKSKAIFPCCNVFGDYVFNNIFPYQTFHMSLENG